MHGKIFIPKSLIHLLCKTNILKSKFYLTNKSMIMKKNVGQIDKLIRVLIALVIALLYYFGVISGTLAIVLAVFAIILLVTSLINFCPLYTLFKINTCKSKQA